MDGNTNVSLMLSYIDPVGWLYVTPYPVVTVRCAPFYLIQRCPVDTPCMGLKKGSYGYTPSWLLYGYKLQHSYDVATVTGHRIFHQLPVAVPTRR